MFETTNLDFKYTPEVSLCKRELVITLNSGKKKHFNLDSCKNHLSQERPETRAKLKKGAGETLLNLCLLLTRDHLI